jgi:hypothetical protein
LVFRSLQKVSVPFPQHLALTSNRRQDNHQNFLYLHRNSLEELLEAEITQVNLFLVNIPVYLLYKHDFKQYITNKFCFLYLVHKKLYLCKNAKF